MHLKWREWKLKSIYLSIYPYMSEQEQTTASSEDTLLCGKIHAERMCFSVLAPIKCIRI